MSIINTLKERLKTLEISPKRSLGQNFLIGEQVIDQILNCISLCSASHILEVGPGLGALTESLEIKKLTLIELDRCFCKYWKERGYKVIEADALKMSWDQLFLPKNSLLVSNLPYQIAARLVIERSLGPTEVVSMVLMFQKEVAQRILAETGAKNYGFLSVIAQVYWDIDFVLEAGPNEFYPSPSVASQVLLFKRKEIKSEMISPQFLNFVKAGFSQRRKLLIKNILQAKKDVKKETWNQIFTDMGLTQKVRPQEISPKQFLDMYSRVSQWE